MSEPSARTSREDALVRIRELRAALRDPQRLPDATAPAAPATHASDATIESLQTKYEMEMAAHRETTQELLAEKDRTILRLEQQVADLSERLRAATNSE